MGSRSIALSTRMRRSAAAARNQVGIRLLDRSWTPKPRRSPENHDCARRAGVRETMPASPWGVGVHDGDSDGPEPLWAKELDPDISLTLPTPRCTVPPPNPAGCMAGSPKTDPCRRFRAETASSSTRLTAKAIDSCASPPEMAMHISLLFQDQCRCHS
jgi:hypothetical protein